MRRKSKEFRSWLERTLREYQQVLRLMDWKISVEIVPAKEIGKCFGRTVIWETLKQAAVAICDPGTFEPGPEKASFDPEVTLVHELLHVQFGLRSTGKLQFEQAIDSVAKGIVELRGGRRRK